MLSLFHILCSLLPLLNLTRSIPVRLNNHVESDTNQVEFSAITSSIPVHSNLLPIQPLGSSSVNTQQNILSSESHVVRLPLVMAYYPGWAADSYPPEKIPFKKLDWVDFAFAIPTKDFRMSWDSGGSPPLLDRLVAAAHAHNTKVKVSIGGWGGSEHFSSAVATPESRQQFVDNIQQVYWKHSLDGIDLDWEYPGRQGAGKNMVRPEDSANFLSFLQLLRQALPEAARISVAATQTAFADVNGEPMKWLAPFVSLVDWIMLMNYDVCGSSSEPGPNAPLSNGCHNSSQPDSNAVAAINNWISAGFPREKLVLGLPAYGYMSTSTAARLRQRRRFDIDSQDVNPTPSPLRIVNSDGRSEGQVNFRQLVEQGALLAIPSANTNDPATFSATGGFERFWDACSSTPYLRSSGAGQVITYDDTDSLWKKAVFASKVGMLGVNFFDITGDTNNSDLLRTVIKALGHDA